jgi:hypothetical protein
LNTRFGPRWPAKVLFEYEFREFARVTIAAIVIGWAAWAAWAAHVAARARGVRWPISRRPDQASDYADDGVVPSKG